MGRIFVIIGGLLVLILTAALIIPPFVDWTGYRAQFEREASRILGRPVHVNGIANARLLPFPSVTFTDVTVGDRPDDPLMKIERFYMGAELMPFLRGQILIFDMKVEKPQIRVVFDEEGRLDWSLRTEAAFDPAQVRVENLTISDGLIDITDMQTSREHSIRNLDAVISAKSLKGPWLASGRFSVDNERADFELSTGEVRDDGAIRLRLKASADNVPAVFDMDGDVAIEDGKIGYNGRFNIRSQDIAKTAKRGSGNAQSEKLSDGSVAPPLIADLHLSGQFEANRESLIIDEFRMEQGPADHPYIVNGKARFDYSKAASFEVFADGQQLFWGNAQQETPEKKTNVTLDERIKSFETLISQIPVPNIPGSIDLKLPAIIAGDTTIRDIMVKAVPADNGWDIEQFSADLPGRTRIEANGLLGAAPDFGFSGDIIVASRQPTGLVTWLGGQVDEAVRRLNGLGVSGKISLHQGKQKIDDLEIAIGETVLKGGFERLAPDTGIPSLRINLAADHINEDAAQFWSLPFQGLASHGFSDIKLIDNSLVNFSLKSGRVQFQDIQFDGLDLAVRYSKGKADIDRLMISDLAGTTITATGMIHQQADLFSGTMDTTILSEDLSQLFSFLNKKAPDSPILSALVNRSLSYPELFSDSEINIYASLLADNIGGLSTEKSSDKNAAQAEIAFSLSGQSGKMQLDLTGAAQKNSSSGGVLQVQVNGSAQSDEGEKIIALLGVPSLPLGLVGPLSADISLQGEPASGMHSSLTLKGPDSKVAIDGVVSVLEEDVTASGKVNLAFEDAEPFLVTAGYSLPGYGAGLGVDLQSDYQFAKGILRLPELSGRFGLETINAKLDLQKDAAAQPMIRGEIKLEDLDFISLSEMMLGSAIADGDKRFSKTPFLKQPSLPLSFDIKVSAPKAYAGSFGRVDTLTARIAKQDDLLEIREIAGSWLGGDLTGQMKLRNNDGNAFFSSELSWLGADFHTIYQVTDGSRPLGGQMKLGLSLSGNGGTMDELVHSMSGGAKLDVDPLIIKGLDDASLPVMLDAIQQLADQKSTNTATQLISELDYSDIADKLIGHGEFRTELKDAQITIAGGVARLPVTKLESRNGNVEAELQMSLSDLSLQGGGSFQFKATENDASAPLVQFQISNVLFTPEIHFNNNSLIQYLTQYALKREQERVEVLQASLIEKQVLRRKIELYQSRLKEREERILEEEKRRREDAKQRAEAKEEHEIITNEASSAAPDFNPDAISDLLRDLN